MHQSGRAWLLVIAVTAVCTDAIAGHEDKVGGIKGEQVQQQQQQQQQQQSDLMQRLADGGGDHRSAQMTSPADGYFDEQLGPLGYLAKRAHKQYGFGLGKRLYRQYEFGLGKRSASKQYGFGLGKRAASKQYGFGLGKRASPTFYSFGLGRRASPQYSFGLGKRVSQPSFLNVDDRDSDYTYNDLSEERKRTADDIGGRGQRFAFGLGKRGAGAEWEDGGGDDDAAPVMWHPAVRRARLQYGFGLGKRAADGDYDAATEYAAETMQMADDAAADIN